MSKVDVLWPRLRSLLAVGAILVPAALGAQEGGIPFGTGVEHDPGQPVEITSDSLSVDQAAGTAHFRGSVIVGQGELRLAADEVEVFYAEGAGPDGGGAVDRIRATGAVTVTNGAEAAEADEALYQVASGTIEMTGEVVLTQGRNAISGDRLTIDLNGSIANMEGRVQTIVVPGAQQSGTRQ